MEWLEEFLKNQNIPMVPVNYDHELLDQVYTKIVDTECGLATKYDVNYLQFLQSKRGMFTVFSYVSITIVSSL